jgi:hypothetical protein
MHFAISHLYLIGFRLYIPLKLQSAVFEIHLWEQQHANLALQQLTV